MVLHFIARLVSNVLGNVYPAYASYKASVSNNPAEHRQWLMFWIVSTALTVFEMLFEVFVSWLPLYYEAKIVFLVWLTLPKFKGATVIYTKFVEPFLRQHEESIDSTLEQLYNAAGEKIASARVSGGEFLRTRGADALRRGSEFVSQATVQAAAAAAAANTTPASTTEGKDGSDSD